MPSAPRRQKKLPEPKGRADVPWRRRRPLARGRLRTDLRGRKEALMLLKDVMTKDIEEIGPETSLQDAAKKMKSLNIGALPVCENNRLVGFVTDRDIAV